MLGELEGWNVKIKITLTFQRKLIHPSRHSNILRRPPHIKATKISIFPPSIQPSLQVAFSTFEPDPEGSFQLHTVVKEKYPSVPNYRGTNHITYTAK